MLRIAPVAAIGLVCMFGAALDRASAGEMQAPRITRAVVDWDGASASLGAVAALQVAHASADTPTESPAIDRLNAATATQLPGIARSAIPVLLPFDVDADLRDRVAGTAPADPDKAYGRGFGRPVFFAPGPAGYDADYRFSLAGIPTLADIRFSADVNLMVSGSLLTYEVDPPVAEAAVNVGTSVPALEADFPGIRRSMSENYVRYSFVRWGVPYVVAIDCFDGGRARFHHMACRDADRVIALVLTSLRLVGGMPPSATTAAIPESAATIAPQTIARPAAVSPTFTYYPAGRLVPGTGPHNGNGRADDTVYSAIRFPVAAAPAFADTQYFARRVIGGVAAYPWRDNFCERRGFYVGQCPGGSGHQGQDIRAAACSTTSAGDDRCASDQNDVVAARDGMIMRAPGQEAVYLVVNTPTEHIRFRYLHMRPKALDAAGVLSGRVVKAGETIGQIGNFSGHENGTSYHLHFDVQVPTRTGWVFVSPYMTLVASYEHLIGARGTELHDDLLASAATTITLNDAETPAMITLASVRRAIVAPAEPEIADLSLRYGGCTGRHRARCAAAHDRATHLGATHRHGPRFATRARATLAMHRSRRHRS